MKTNLIKVTGDWLDVVNACRSTVSKPPLGREPSKAFKTKILISEHSPIRLISFLWDWRAIMSWVATHWSRHKFEKFISTQRTDRTGIDRNKLPQDEEVDFMGYANVQNLIDAFRKRLCYTASPETRALGEDFRAVLRMIEPEISDVLVPNCVYRCGCPEMDMCENKTWLQFKTWCESAHSLKPELLGIKRRYDLYNEWFYLQHGLLRKVDDRDGSQEE